MNARFICCASLVFTLAGISAGQNVGAPETDPDRVAKNKSRILKNLRREKPIYRGTKPGEVRFRWEWYNRMVGNYIYERSALLIVEAYRVNAPHDLRPGYMYRDMTVTFEEIFGALDGDDDKLVPILSHRDFLGLIPNSSLVGLTLRGKQGEVKGVVTRKYKYVSLYGGGIVDNLEYKTPAGKIARAAGIAPDAFTILWKDLKNVVADNVSEAKAIEDLELVRDLLYPDETDEKEDKKKGQ